MLGGLVEPDGKPWKNALGCWLSPQWKHHCHMEQSTAGGHWPVQSVTVDTCHGDSLAVTNQWQCSLQLSL